MHLQKKLGPQAHEELKGDDLRNRVHCRQVSLEAHPTVFSIPSLRPLQPTILSAMLTTSRPPSSRPARTRAWRAQTRRPDPSADLDEPACAIPSTAAACCSATTSPILPARCCVWDPGSSTTMRACRSAIERTAVNERSGRPRRAGEQTSINLSEASLCHCGRGQREFELEKGLEKSTNAPTHPHRRAPESLPDL